MDSPSKFLYSYRKGLRTTGTEYKLVATRILNKALVLPNKAQCSNLDARLRHRYKKLDLKLDFKYNAINYFSDQFSDYLSEQHFKLWSLIVLGSIIFLDFQVNLFIFYNIDYYKFKFQIFCALYHNWYLILNLNMRIKIIHFVYFSSIVE